MVATDHDSHERGRLSRLHQRSQRTVPISASGAFRKVKPVQFPLQSVSKRRVCSVLSLFGISQLLKSQDKDNEPSRTWRGGES